MRKIINNPEHYLHEMLEGIYMAYPNQLTYIENDYACLVRTQVVPNKVALITGGGSGHLPLFLGYVGEGVLDGCAVGDVFQSPSSEQILQLTKYLDQGKGVLYIYGNYNGDIFNFDIAAEMANFEYGIETATVLGIDDISSPKAGEDEKETRRGVAGIYFLYKCAGAAAALNQSLEAVRLVAEKTSAHLATMGVALSPSTVPRVGKPGFSIPENAMEIGMGIHGEPGLRSGELLSADEISNELLVRIIEELRLSEGDRVAVLVNGLGATPLDEQFIVTRCVQRILDDKKIKVHRFYVGEYATSLEMSGLSISVLKLDSELESYLDYPVNTPFVNQVSL